MAYKVDLLMSRWRDRFIAKFGHGPDRWQEREYRLGIRDGLELLKQIIQERY